MRFPYLSQTAAWPLVVILLASLTPHCAAATQDTGVLEIDLVFPRNETYAPTDHLPIVFAFRNASLARYLDFRKIYFGLTGPSSPESKFRYAISFHSIDLNAANWTAHPSTYHAYTYLSNFTAPGNFTLGWHFSWGHCHLPNFTSAYVPEMSASADLGIRIEHGGRPATDLVAATANTTTCLRNGGFAVNVTRTMSVPEWIQGFTWKNGDTCGVVDPEEKVVAEPCAARIDEVAAASMAAARECHMANATDACSAGSVVGGPLGMGAVVAGWWCIAAVLGAAGFLLA
ncbi:hypothetical protein C8A05DRAFT_35389 [Staphylotrichum tortipilum]|uniref:DUF7136 domain-containing protein n=1 Tax=Staphylotrichum tortipilum TaxID=2831512 RepID=A0AAN6MI15_9PEZI|nr:hypothetical protein C8A05DRAFT_35389 [Staphylotrichum longicolle]